MGNSKVDIQKLYIAYFGRPADPEGLAFYLDHGSDLVHIARVFSASEESRALYGNKAAGELVSAIYQNLFGRAPEPAGLAYWANEIIQGTLSSGEVALIVLGAAQNSDAVVIDNKLIVAQAFTDAIDTDAELVGYRGAASSAIAREFLSTITDAASSIANLDRIVTKGVADATGTGPSPIPTSTPTSPPVFAATLSGTTISFTHPGEEIALTVTGTSPQIYEFSTSGTMTGTSRVEVTGTLTNIVVPSGKALSIQEADFAAISAFGGAGTIKVINPANSEVTASILQGHDDAVSGLLDATAYTKITGTVADLTAILITNQGISGNKIKTAADVEVVISGTTTATAAELRALEAATTGFVDATAITTLTGTIADAKLMLVTNKGTVGDKISMASAVNLTLSDVGAVAAADIRAIDAATTGLISATDVTGITGTADDVKTVLTASKQNTYTLNLPDLTAITLTDASVTGTIPVGSIRNETVVTLADVPGNYVWVSSGTVLVGGALTIDATALTGTNYLEYAHSSLSSTPITIRGGAGNEVIRAGLGNDTVYGGGGNDTIRGNDGNDTIYGEGGNDTIFGGEGNDIINGGDGDDRIEGGNGADILTGGAGADIFRYFNPMEGGDTITDFSSEDRIIISELDFPGYGRVVERSAAGAYTDAVNPDGAGTLLLYTNTSTGIMQLIADYNGNGGGYSYVVVTFAAGTTATVGQIVFYSYEGDGWGS